MKKILAVTSYLILLLIILCPSKVNAQAKTVIKGKVTEATTGKPIGGVSVTEVNENDRQVNGVSTDESGDFAVRVADTKNKLRFSYIGFATKTQSIGNKVTINVTLSSDTSNSGDVVILSRKSSDVVSTGITSTSKRDLTGAVASIQASVLENQSVTSVEQMIQGRAAGVQVVASSGDPGAGFDIRIRGAASLNGNNAPLYIIDGVPIISTPYDGTNSAQAGVAKINPIADINPSDIESIDILKDGSAAAIYGSRAANGVVIITTKRGRKNVTRIEFGTQLGVTEAPKPVPVLNGSQYKVMRLEALQNNGTINPNLDATRALLNDPTYFSYWYYQSDTKWTDLVTRTGVVQNYNLSLSGGGESVKYIFTTSYNDQAGTTINSGANRITGRFNLDYKVSNKLRFTAQLAFTRSHTFNMPNISSGGTVLNAALIKAPNMPVYDVDLTTGKPLTSYLSLGGIQGGLDNPVAFAKTISNDAYGYNLAPNIKVDYDIAKGLKFTNTTSLNYFAENGFVYFPAAATGLIWNDQNFNKIDTRANETTQLDINNLLYYNKTFGTKYRTSFVLGNNFNNYNGNNLNISGYANPSEQIQTLNGPARIRSINTGTSLSHGVSFFANANLIYDDRFGVTFTIRRDGSSKFGDARRFGDFPAVSGYWRISSEPIIKRNLKFVDDIKFRAAWGRNGNSSGVPNYAYISQYNAGANYLGYTGIVQGNAELTNIQWEVVNQLNWGLDMAMFNNRFNITLDVYNKETQKLLYNQGLPSSSGLPRDGNGNSTIYTNLGNIRNKGIELDLRYIILPPSKSKLGWNVDFNIARNVNEVTKLPGGTLTFTNATVGGFVNQVKQGDGLGTYYGYRFLGVYATDADAIVKDAKGAKVSEADGVTPKYMKIGTETGNPFKGGDAIYQDLNHDGIIDDQDKQLIGNANALFFGGLNSEFTYKSFTVSVFFQYNYGNNIINGTKYNLERMNATDNQAVSVLRRWRKQGDITDMPRAIDNDNRNSLASTRWVEDGSYLRLKNVSLAYHLPNKLVQRIGLKSVDVRFIGYNLYTWTNYTGSDPEISISGNPSFIGIDQALSPVPKGYTFGLNVRF